MKVITCLVFVFVTTAVCTAYAQNSNTTINGLVKDINNRPLSHATVLLQSVTDSVFRKTTVANEDGAFYFNDVPVATYRITCSMTGFNNYYIERLSIDGGMRITRLPVIILRGSSTRLLKEVIVTTKKPLVEHKMDRTIVNVDAMINAAGSDALEVLSKSPGVMVGQNDEISLNGKRNVLVLIDDKPTYMSAQDLAAYLRSLPGGMLDKLELISNPPARYDASGGAIINIVLKKDRTAGFNGTVITGYNQGVYARYNASLNINYRTKKFNLFGNVGYNRDQNFSSDTYNRYFHGTDGAIKSSILQESRSKYISNGWTGRLGLDYFLSGATTVGVVLTGNTRPKNDQLDYSNQQYSNSIQLDSMGAGHNRGKYESANAGVNINLQHKFDSIGTLVTFNADYLNYHSDGNRNAPLQVYLPDGSLFSNQDRLFTTPSQVDIYAAKVDYVHPLGAHASIEAGLKSSTVTTSNQSNWFNNHILDYSRSNDFRYAESINGAYLSVKNEWKRWSVKAGLRAEYTFSKGHQLSNPAIPDSSFTKQYTNLFPSFYLSYKLDSAGNNIVRLSYSKRIHRPGYQQLNPFLFFQDQYSYTSGNPYIVPDFTQYFELGYAWREYFGITLTYWLSRGQVSPVTRASENIFITRPQNFINNQTIGAIPYVSVTPYKWWTLHINAVLFYIINKGTADGISINQRTNIHEIETSNTFQLSKTLSMELNGFFPGKQSFGQSKNGSVYNISGGVQKKVLKGLGSVRINVNDIFNTIHPHSQTTDINQVTAFSTRNSDTRRVGISFTYRFGKSANARKRNDSSSADDEKSRTN